MGFFLSLYRYIRLFVGLRPTRKFFTHMETSPLPVKGIKFWPLLGTHGHWVVRVLKRATPECDTEHPFIMVISEESLHSHLLPSVWQWSCHYLFLRLKSVAAGIYIDLIIDIVVIVIRLVLVKICVDTLVFQTRLFFLLTFKISLSHFNLWEHST